MSAEGLWDWSLRVYAAPGVAPALLQLQDAAAQNAPLLLWGAWARPDAARADEGAELARRWETAVVAPLRQVRRSLKAPQPAVSPDGAERLREQVKACELAAEKLLLDALEALGPASSASLEAGLEHVAHAWSGASRPDLSALTSALSSAA